MSPIVWVVIAALICINAFYVSAEFGAVGVRRSRIKWMADGGNALARRLLPYIETPAGLSQYVAASQIGITVSSLILGAYAQATLAVAAAGMLAARLGVDADRARDAAEVIVLLSLAAFQAVVGELIPKSVALEFPTEVALATVLPMRWSLRVYRPFIAAINWATMLILRLVGARLSPQRHIHSPDEIDLLLAESRDGGLLEPEEQQRLHRALRLGRRTVRDLMVPLESLTMVRDDIAWSDLTSAVMSSPFSRLPVYRGRRDQVIGVLRVKDLVNRFVQQGPTPLAQLMRPVERVSQDLPADRIAAALRERRAHQAIVVDASGIVVGLITIQDVLVALVGGGRRRA
ncbi:MAG TPA: hemolysin family protein [Vicinamibacterales bacterium]|nr:hemolysin family protein [Vicinamibacterales bacterium]